MQSKDQFSLLRTILKALGLSPEAINDVIDRITDFLTEKDDKPTIEIPYQVRDDFLTPAEHSFYLVLKSIIPGSITICPKVALGDLFYPKTKDPSRYRTYTNKIDRKHVDFLLCDASTMRPIAGIELDDRSHQREDRKIRDAFVESVFQGARLPLLRTPVKSGYIVQELDDLLRPYIQKKESIDKITSGSPEHPAQPVCPKCGSRMVLRTAKSGANEGSQFWGCSNFPQCRGILKYE